MIETLRQSLRDRIESPKRYTADRFDGRGIVICAGGPRYFTCAWVLISVLRHIHAVNLPIQVWHLGRGEMSEEMRLLLEEMRVEVVDAESVIARFPARIAGGWPLKPYAIQQSRFREVLYLDADTVPLTDPSKVFDWELYRSNGVLMRPDRVDMKASNSIWRALELEPRDCTSVESGILVIDKQRAWHALDLSVLLNEHADDIYGAVHGDKDTLLLSSLLLGITPVLMPHRPFLFDVDMVQRDPNGDPFLHHRNGSKWNLRGDNRPVASAELTPACEQAIAVLNHKWSGVVFNAPPQSPRAQAEEKRLIAAPQFFCEPVGAEGRRLELLPGGRIGEGRDRLAQHWAVIERDSKLVLQFYSSTRLVIEMTRSADDAWEGRSLTPDAFSVRLISDEAHATWPHAGSARVAASATDLVTALMDLPLFAVGFDADRADELRAALSLLNDHFDDLPELIDLRIESNPVSNAWRDALATLSADLSARRDRRIVLATRTRYSHYLDPNGYERVP